MPGKSRSYQEYQAIVLGIEQALQKNPELTIGEACEEFDIKRGALAYWKAKLAKESEPQEKRTRKKRTKSVPQLISIPEVEKKEIKILIGDADAIGAIMTRLGY